MRPSFDRWQRVCAVLCASLTISAVPAVAQDVDSAIPRIHRPRVRRDHRESIGSKA
jgi:hypothetical protein